jgi:ubiquinone/menaquinone biosynthesis C-methylase UbiE
MDFTEKQCERYMPSVDSAEISYEHWHRYLYATQFVNDKVVLDIACGEGYGAFLLAKHAKKVIGIDISQEVVFRASNKYIRHNLEFHIGSVAAIPLKVNEAFDIITSFETIEHVSEEDQKKFLLEVKRLLKPNGLFIVSTPNKLTFSDARNCNCKYHIKEFYIQEYKEFLKKFFHHIVILGQKSYPISYIWNPYKDKATLIEYRLNKTDTGFEPTEVQKEIFIAIAICSNEPIQDQKNSILVDISGALLNQLFQKNIQLNWMEEQIKQKEEQIKQKEEQIKQKEEQLLNVQIKLIGVLNNPAWKFTAPLRWIGRNLIIRPYRAIRHSTHDNNRP